MSTDAWLHHAERVYPDSNILIYYVEGENPFQDRIGSVLREAVARSIPIFINEIGVCECLYGAYRLGRHELEAQYLELLFDTDIFTIAPVSFDLLIASARLGAGTGLTLLDATHYVSALEAGCDHLVTNDRKFRSDADLNVVQIGAIR
ncbi:PIN domain-containing protein [Rhizobium sp. TRM95111]|uniref:type II toxin-antitoxin system VapC family toxin n=1 Tax=Rhizobium alarense TaxID=2846851 RepID=UPI001F1776EA|nr:PIN domain-containing protein [Rhizobium alarense]MCF3642722.1 PIN domain-containing protein [Rhizobium alarense]